MATPVLNWFGVPTFRGSFLPADLALTLLVKHQHNKHQQWHFLASALSFQSLLTILPLLLMIAANCDSFSSKPRNRRPKQLAASPPLGRPFSKEIRDSSADGSLDRRQLHAQPRKRAIPALTAPARTWTPAPTWMSSLFQRLLHVCFRLHACLSSKKKNSLWARHFVANPFDCKSSLQKHCDTAGQQRQGTPGWVWLLLGWLFCPPEEQNFSWLSSSKRVDDVTK